VSWRARRVGRAARGEMGLGSGFGVAEMEKGKERRRRRVKEGRTARLYRDISMLALRTETKGEYCKRFWD
jgi:hypothetical protein